MKQPKILVAVPCMEQVAAGFAASLATLNKVGECSVFFICNSLIYEARNKIALGAIKNEFDYVMWFDSDMVFEPDTLQRLLKDSLENNIDIVSGLYFRRVAPYTPVVFETIEIEGDKTTFKDYVGELSGLREVQGAGFGCMLTKVSTLFEVFAKYGNCFSPIGNVGEDLSFLWRARQLGHPTFCDFDVKCGHIGNITVNQEFFTKLQRGGQKNETYSNISDIH